jgi:hypothetical protein
MLPSITLLLHHFPTVHVPLTIWNELQLVHGFVVPCLRLSCNTLRTGSTARGSKPQVCGIDCIPMVKSASNDAKVD